MNWVAYAFTIIPYVQNLNPRFGLQRTERHVLGLSEVCFEVAEPLTNKWGD